MCELDGFPFCWSQIDNRQVVTKIFYLAQKLVVSVELTTCLPSCLTGPAMRIQPPWAPTPPPNQKSWQSKKARMHDMPQHSETQKFSKIFVLSPLILQMRKVRLNFYNANILIVNNAWRAIAAVIHSQLCLAG